VGCRDCIGCVGCVNCTGLRGVVGARDQHVDPPAGLAA